jgi:hypothetical protein
VAAMLGAASVGGCGELEAGEASPGHVHGLVVLAPSCPVETVGEACAPRPAAGGPAASSNAVPVTVRSGQEATVRLDIDSGIR